MVLLPDIIPEQRRGLVLEFLLRRGAASIQELANAVSASSSTIRRDLEQLELEGHVRRTHGGAVLANASHSTFEPDAEISAMIQQAEKSTIGRVAADCLSVGDSVIFDSGSTVHAAAHFAVERGILLTAVTNDLGIGQVLAGSDKIRVVVIGGSVRRNSLTLIGEPGQSFMGDIHADVAFIGTHSISGSLLTETSIEIASIKQAMIAAARRVILLADSSKFKPAAFYKICEVTSMHEVITDNQADPALLADLRDMGLKVTAVEVPGSSGSK